jgi:sugar O-acyltransferase (sialic acid O-acetyltransferase NeuD family)
MLLYGAGGHAKVIISALLDHEIPVKAVFDDDPGRKPINGIAICNGYNSTVFPGEMLIISIGNNSIRKHISEIIQHSFGSITHPSASVDRSVEAGEGTCILHHAVVQADSLLGRHVIINTAATVDHDCIIQDFVHLAPGVILAGNVRVGENTLIGAGSIVAPGLTIGKNCFVAAGSVVTINIPDGATVRGNPARIISRNL